VRHLDLDNWPHLVFFPVILLPGPRLFFLVTFPFRLNARFGFSSVAVALSSDVSASVLVFFLDTLPFFVVMSLSICSSGFVFMTAIFFIDRCPAHAAAAVEAAVAGNFCVIFEMACFSSSQCRFLFPSPGVRACQPGRCAWVFSSLPGKVRPCPSF